MRSIHQCTRWLCLALLPSLVLAMLSCGDQPARPNNSFPNTAPAPILAATRLATGPTSGPSGAWATKLDLPGLPNLHKVSGHLYRGAQPADEGFAQLKKLGVKTVINLRSMHSDRQACEKEGLAYIEIPMDTWHAEGEDVVAFLRAATKPENQPVFVHCQHGADRTGTCIAVYRVAVDRWSKDDAIAEMTEGGFGFHAIWQNLIDYVRQVDEKKLRQAMAPER